MPSREPPEENPRAGERVIVEHGGGGMLQAGGQVAQSLISGFTGSPSLLLIVVLNVAMIIAAAMFLSRQEDTRNETLDKFAVILDSCINHTVPIAALQIMFGGGGYDRPRSTNSIAPAELFEPPEKYTLGQDDELQPREREKE